MKLRLYSYLIIIISLLMAGVQVWAIDVAATGKALRLSNTITGGFMPSSDPLFAQMVTKVQAGDISGAALIAASSSYAANYLARRLALEMQSPALDASITRDSDATAFIMAHFIGAAGTKPSISSIWSENATYLVNVNGAPIHASAITAAQLPTIDWSTALSRVPGQNAKTVTTVNNQTTVSPIAIPAKHVGGYLTLSDVANDTSFAMYGATAGTNLRMIEGMWEIATGLSLVDVQSSLARPQDVPRFVPEYNPNFFKGQGQASCISCHGGGFSSLNHGYSTVADQFDFDPKNGFVYFPTPAIATMKSLGSDPKKRQTNSTCNLSKTPTAVCNPDSLGADPNQSWDLNSTWASTGVLANMGWKGPSQGAGLNALGQALGQAAIVYRFLAKRVVREICPMGTLTEAEISSIADAANPYATIPGTDDLKTIISLVASHATCQ